MSAEFPQQAAPLGDHDPVAQRYSPHADGHPAKLWEAMRRNAEFGSVAERVVKLAHSKEPSEWSKAYFEIQQFRETHPFARTALIWLCPNPTFHFRYHGCVDG